MAIHGENPSGAAGAAFATEFLSFLKVWQAMPNIDAILIDPMKAAVPTDPTLYAIASAISRKPGRVFAYLSRLPKEFEVCATPDIVRLDNKMIQTRQFIKPDWPVNALCQLAKRFESTGFARLQRQRRAS